MNVYVAVSSSRFSPVLANQLLQLYLKALYITFKNKDFAFIFYYITKNKNTLV